jgi:hypothetical protein
VRRQQAHTVSLHPTRKQVRLTRLNPHFGGFEVRFRGGGCSRSKRQKSGGEEQSTSNIFMSAKPLVLRGDCAAMVDFLRHASIVFALRASVSPILHSASSSTCRPVVMASAVAIGVGVAAAAFFVCVPPLPPQTHSQVARVAPGWLPSANIEAGLLLGAHSTRAASSQR